MSADPLPISISDTHFQLFRNDLIDWFEAVKREMPWRETTDPYCIWVSEIMLQQTRVDQAQPYYERFTAAFPTVETLAAADIDEVLKKWEGLGYYSRARNLHRAAQLVVDTFEGRVPDTYDAIRTLPGIGPYTAAAILSLAYGKPHAVLDGNVARVLTRVFAIGEEVSKTHTKRHLQEMADALLDPARPGPFNEAMMELGATVCSPTNPACALCALHDVCEAFALGTPEAFPVKKKKAPVPHYDIAVGLIFDEEGRILIQRRPEDKMLGGLWEFPGGKHKAGETMEAACHRELREELGIEVAIDDLFQRVSHAFTHFKITLHAFRCHIVEGLPEAREHQPMQWVTLSELTDYAFPRANRRLIEALNERIANPTLFDESKSL